MNDELLPCPFCGAPAASGGDEHEWQVACSRDCDATPCASKPTREEAEAIWNRRTASRAAVGVPADAWRDPASPHFAAPSADMNAATPKGMERGFFHCPTHGYATYNLPPKSVWFCPACERTAQREELQRAKSEGRE